MIAFPPMPNGVVGHCVTLLESNRFMVIGGNQGGTVGSRSTFVVSKFKTNPEEIWIFVISKFAQT